MANQWLRLWHDMPTDPKFGTIARLSKQPKALVLATYLNIIVDASQSEPRGTFKMAVEDIASSLDEDEAAVQSIVDVMQGRVLNGNEVSGWILRQPVREDGAAGERSATTSSNYVYFVSATGSDVVKIGFSKNPWSRAKDLQVGSATKFELLAAFRTDTRHEFEIHKFFTATRQSGEWFKRSEALNSLITKVISKDIESHDGCIEFLKSLDAACFVATTVVSRSVVVTTKDKDKDKEEELIPSLSESAIPPDSVDQDIPAKPEFKKTPIPACPFDALVDAYETALPNLPGVTRSLFRDGVNGKATAQRWAWVLTATHEKGSKKGQRLAVTQQDGIDWFSRFFTYATGSDFLTGANGKFTGCSLGWLMTKTNFEKVLAGNYHMEKAA